jgi:chromosome segregation ATPase
VEQQEVVELRLANELRVAQARQAALELEILNARDHTIGRAAELANTQHELAVARHQLAAARHQLAALRRELAAVHSSTTWKLGRIVMLPIRILRRLGQR